MKTFKILAPAILAVLAAGFSWADIRKEEEALSSYFEKDVLVEAATRTPKPLAQVAENVTIITAAEIRAMNAHSVYDVLYRVNGVFVGWSGHDMGSTGLLYAQGSMETHVLLLLDEIPWNWVGGGNAEPGQIPIGIIERIEVIKGPASSTWGSALGGVINIVTKKTGTTETPSGSISSTFGEDNTTDTSAEVSGAAGKLGYYLYAGHQRSDGLFNDDDFKNKAIYGKLSFPVSEGTILSATFGYGKPEKNNGDIVAAGLFAQENAEVVYGTAALDGAFSDKIGYHLGFSSFSHVLENYTAEDGQYGPAGSRYRDNSFDEDQTNGNARLVWKEAGHTVVFGGDYGHCEFDRKSLFGDYLQSLGAPASFRMKADQDRWGAYVNDSYTMGGLTMTAGLRYDDNTETKSFLSPSVGGVYRLGNEVLVRGSVARGFTSPGLNNTKGGGLFLDPNPDLEPEEVWSYQLGAEAAVAGLVWLKGNLFLHDLRNALVTVPNPENPDHEIYINSGRIRRTGFEAEFETAPVLGFVLSSGICYVHIKPEEDLEEQDQYSIDAGLKYSMGWFSGNLLGRQMWWDRPKVNPGERNEFLWDLNLSATKRLAEGSALELIFAAHNLFNGDQHDEQYFSNPGRWVEAGARVTF